jgi:predicted dehydrogenase
VCGHRINHNHINSQVTAVLRGGGQLTSVYAKEPDLLAGFTQRFPQAKVARSEAEILEDSAIQLVLSSIIPEERAPLGIRVMQHGKDYMSDKPGITTLEQLADVRRVQAQTHRIYSIMYSERLENRATIKAAELVSAGAIGHVVQTIGTGPHRMSPKERPAWFFDRPRYGGILCDIGSSGRLGSCISRGPRGRTSLRRRSATSTTRSNGFRDFRDILLRGDGGTGYIRVDWFLRGLATWGDGRFRSSAPT